MEHTFIEILRRALDEELARDDRPNSARVILDLYEVCSLELANPAAVEGQLW